MTNREIVELKLDESNELLFKVTIQGANASPAKVRLVCEDSDVSYMFEGHSTDDGEIRFIVPSMKGKLKEGTQYFTKVEVLVENRYFSPVEFDIEFKQSLKVVSEGSIRVNTGAVKTQPVSVSVQMKPVAPAVKQEAPKPLPVITEPPKPRTLAEKFTKPVTKQNVSGLDDAVMEEVARSSVRRLLGR